MDRPVIRVAAKAGSKPTPWPILRARSLFGGGKEVVRLDPSGLSFLRTRQPLTDELLGPTSPPTPDRGWVLIPAFNVVRAGTYKVGFITESSLWDRYWLETSGGHRVFRVPNRESALITSCLREILGGRFDAATKTRPAWQEIALVLFVIFSLAAFSLVVLHPGYIAVGIVGLCLAFFAYRQLRDGRDCSPYAPAEPEAVRQRAAATGKPPFRSVPLGWALKVFGLIPFGWVAYLLWVDFHEQDSPGGLVCSFGPLIALAFWFAGMAVEVGHRLCLKSLGCPEPSDARPPFVFLRAFDDDDRQTYQPTDWLAWLQGINSPAIIPQGPLTGWKVIPSLHPMKLFRKFFDSDPYATEELLASALKHRGPLVAIGQPGEALATPGASRVYATDAGWQEVVLTWLGRCQAVILQPGQSAGIRWEIARTFRDVPRRRILLSMLAFQNRPEVYDEFRSWFAADFSIRLPVSIPFQAAPCFVYFEEDGTPRVQPVCYKSPLLWAWTGNAVDVTRTFHSFLQGLDGGPRDLPSQQQPHWGHRLLAVLMLTAVFGLMALLVTGFFWRTVQAGP